MPKLIVKGQYENYPYYDHSILDRLAPECKDREKLRSWWSKIRRDTLQSQRDDRARIRKTILEPAKQSLRDNRAKTANESQT